MLQCIKDHFLTIAGGVDSYMICRRPVAREKLVIFDIHRDFQILPISDANNR